MEGAEGMSSAELKELVTRGREFRSWRRSKDEDADIPVSSKSIDGVVSAFMLDSDAEDSVLALAKRTHLTGRGIVRLCRIARTVADVLESDRVQVEHVLEAAMYQGRRDE